MEFVRKLGSRGRTGLAVVGGLTIAGQYVTWKQAQNLKAKASKDRVLQLDLTMTITEAAPSLFDQVVNSQRPPMSLKQVVDAIESASSDPSVKGIVCTQASDKPLSMATMQEIRNAILAFRGAQEHPGRPAVYAGDTFGESGQGTGQYYLATAFDKVYLQPTGLVGIVGLHSESFFLKGLLARMGVQPQFLAYFEYKNAANMFTQDGFTKQHREQTTRLMDSIFRQIVGGIAAARGIDEGRVRAMIDECPLTGQAAVDRGLVDNLRYHDEVLAELGVGKECPVQDLAKYHKDLEKAKKKKED
eukprot:CAMPEP_0173427028 /NCGR_PEP_ID=MMETSP1357-20121228/6327_1 /TAXON_ID=77926 /ORGANISM="Hemiselmis rufescens, Strain PCC563" /LENGTH=301 /DNA_ID=CAMNT_0014390773 /DNA_START=103 /DNA_END=1005 /DNA_ORIENTATION=-